MSHKTKKKITFNRRSLITGATGLAGILALSKPPAFAQAKVTKLLVAHANGVPDSGAIGLSWMAEEVTKRSKGELVLEFHGGTLLTKEMEIMNAVRSGNIAMGNPGGVTGTILPEMGVFMVPYLVSSYDQAYKLFNGKIGDRLDKQFQQKYGLKSLLFFDYGFRHFWNSRHAIQEPKDLRGMKMRVTPSKVYADTVNGLGGVAVPMPIGELITAAQQGVIDGGDMPIINILNLKIYEISKYVSLSYHAYLPTTQVINLAVWNTLRPDQQKLLLDVGMEAQAKIREITEGPDNLAKAKELLEPKKMVINEANIDSFKAVAREKIWPAYQKEYPELWEEIVSTKV